MRYSYSIMIKYTQKHEEKLTVFSLKDLHLQQKATYLLLTLKLFMVLRNHTLQILLDAHDD